MDVIINEVVSSIRLIDHQSLLDERTLGSIVRAVLAAVDDRDSHRRRREEESQVGDDGRGGIAGTSGRP
jgi:hypothetical protein|uniref:hypothetical protein n=1 Tax=uncultured Sphingomonas sp. TaxID=158754 RepID=UPI0035C9E1DF